MKFVIVFVALFALAVAAPQQPASIDLQVSNVHPEGYDHAFKTSDGTEAQAIGQLKAIGDEVAVVSQGSYTYYDNDGALHSVQYVADENGYRPVSDDIPKAQ